jgi:hypothetical protein
MFLIVIDYPVLTVNTIIILLSIALLTAGVERIASGILLIRPSPSLPTRRSSG